MAVGRITGPLLKANLLRNGVDLAFETDLLYLDVNNGRVGIKTSLPEYDLDVAGTTRSTNLTATTQANLASFTISTDTIASSSSVINLRPASTNPVVYQGKIQTGDLQLSTNTISTTAVDQNLNINTLGTGQVVVNSNLTVNGDVHVTGNLQVDGDTSGTVTIGDSNTDNVEFKAEVNSNIIPDDNELWDLGSDPALGGKRWNTLYTKNLIAQQVTSDNIVVNGIDLTQIQGNIYYVATTGSDTNAGEHEHNPFLTVKKALSVATAGDAVYIYPGTYAEIFPLTIPAGVSIKGAGIRSVKIVPTTATRYNDAFLLNGETTVEDLTVADFFSGGNFFTVTAASAGSTTVNVGSAPFAHTYVSGGTITIGASTYNITNAVYTYTTGVLVLTHTGGTATLGQSVFVSNLTFSCAGPVGSSTRIFPDNGYAFRFADNFLVTTRSPYIRNCTVIAKGSVTSPSDPYGFNSGDAGKGAYIDGAYANAASKEASMLFHSVTFFTPNVDAITAKNGVRIEWLNCFTYFANRGLYAFSSNYGFAQQGKTRLRIDTRLGSWNVGDTLTYYDTDGGTVLASGVIASVDGNYVNLTGRCVGFETITDRAGKTVYANGNAKLSTAVKKFGTASLALDGTGDYITVASQPDFNFNTGNFTLECWVYRNVSGAQHQIFDFRTATVQNAPLLYINTSNTLIYYVAGANRITGGTVSSSNWNHIAVSRSGTDTRVFLNGTQIGSTWTDTTTYIQSPLTVGSRYDGLVGNFNGYIDDLRITKGVAKYTSNFAVPTSPLTGDLSTVLLLHFDGANNSTTFLDDGITVQDLRTTSGGTATLINFADYSDFGAELRSIGSASIYGNYGAYGDGDGVLMYLIGQNFAYVGAGKLTTNDPNDRIAANEVTKLNRAKIYYTSVDNEGNFSVGDAFFINQKTGDVLFNGQSLSITVPAGITFTDGVNSTTITPTDITTGNIRISGNTIESLTGPINVVSANGSINLQNNTYITGNLDVTGDITLGGNIQVGDASTDTINFVGGISSSLTPATTGTYNLGSSSLRWNTAYLSRAEIDGVVIDNNTIQTTIGNDDLILEAAGTGVVSVPNSDVFFGQNLTVDNDLTVTSGTTYLQDVTVTGNITQTGDVNQTGNLTTSGTVEVTGNITATNSLNIADLSISGTTISSTATNSDIFLEANGTGNVVFEDLKVNSNTISSIQTNQDIVLQPQGTGNVIISSNQSLIIPVGDTASRPASPTNGMIRYNSELNRYEGYNNGYWLGLSGVQDADGNTYITAELTPGANDNTIRFYTDGNLMVTIDSTKLFAERLQTSNIDIQDDTITSISTNSDLNLTSTGTGSVRFGNLAVKDNTITNIVADAVTEFVQSGSGYIKIDGTNGVVIPNGSDTSRPPNPVTGMMRYNTQQGLVEVYNGTLWTGVAGSSGGVTYAEASDIAVQYVLVLG